MKKQLLIVLFFTFFIGKAQVAINDTGAEPNDKAMLDVSSTNKGMLIPRMSTADRTALTLAATEDGLYVYDTDTKSFWYWDGTAWNAMGSGASAEDKDWYEEGTTTAPTDIDAEMFHTGNVAVGKNVADVKLDVYQDTDATTMYVENANTDTSLALRTGAFVGVGGAPTGNQGIIGINASVAGDPGGNAYAQMIGVEADVLGISGNNKPLYGFASDVSGENDAPQAGTSNYIHGNGNGMKYGELNYIYTKGDGMVFGNYNFFANSGNGANAGLYNLMNNTTGNGEQMGAFNRLWNNGTGRHFGTYNELRGTGAAGHVATMNVLGAGFDQNHPETVVPITGDSDAKRIGTVNLIAGDGGGEHVAETNVIYSTGDGNHVGVATVLGFDRDNNSNTTTAGYHVGNVNSLSDLGDNLHVGSVNMVGFNVNLSDPVHPVPVSGDSGNQRIGEINMVGGDGNGDHFAENNVVLSSGSGLHIGEANTLGYDFNTHTATDTSGDHYAVLNTVNDIGGARQAGVVNYIGYDYTNGEEVSGDGHHFGVVNYLYGGHDTNAGIPGVQMGTANVILAKTDVNAPYFGGRQYGVLNIIGKDPANIFSTVTDNGDGDHFASYNEVTDLGNGDHIAVFGKVTPNGNGRHIGVYGWVDPTDVGAWAGYFKGYVSAENHVSTISLISGDEAAFDDTNAFVDVQYAEAGFNPVVYSQTGALQVKVFVRISMYDDAYNPQFKLIATKSAGATTVTPVSENDNWTLTETSSDKYVMESEWKPWSAGTNVWDIHLQGKGSMVYITNVYIMVRPLRYTGNTKF